MSYHSTKHHCNDSCLDQGKGQTSLSVIIEITYDMLEYSYLLLVGIVVSELHDLLIDDGGGDRQGLLVD